MLNFKYQKETEFLVSLHTLSQRQTVKENKEITYFISRGPRELEVPSQV